MTDQRPGPDGEPLLRNLTRVIEAGSRIEREAYLARYPELPGELKEFYRERDQEQPGAQPAPDLAAGALVGDYRIIGPLGRGGMGTVYEAEQVSLGRPVALKVLPKGALREARALDRFRREATAVARLSHPGIVAVHGFDQTGDTGYLAMELVRGLDLAQIIDRLRSARMHGRRFVPVSGPHRDEDVGDWAQGRRLAGTLPGEAASAEGIVVDLRNYAQLAAVIAADAADALHHAHTHGVVHRDVKPSNLILGENGRVKLSDFGLAKSVRDLSITRSGDFLGSPAYVSPEQASPRRGRVDERTDVYSLGVTLYEFLTLHQPFPGKDVADVLRNILTLDPPAPSRVQPRVPRDLDTIVLRAIEKDPQRRYPSAREMAEDLRRFLNYEPITSRPLGPGAAGLRWLRRHKVHLALAGMSAAILALSVALARGERVPGRGTDGLASRLAQRWSREVEARPTALGLARLAEELALDAPTAERRAARLGQARRWLAEERFEEAGRALALLDASALLRPVQASADATPIKIELARRLRARLTAPLPAEDARQRRAWLAVLEQQLDDADSLVCAGAAATLGRVGDPSSLGALVDALYRREDAAGRVAILRGLGDLGAAGAVPHVTAWLRDADAWTRFTALEALVALAPADLVRRAALLARDPEAFVRHRQRLLAEEDGRP